MQTPASHDEQYHNAEPVSAPTSAPNISLTAVDYVRIGALAVLEPKTARRVYQGRRCSTSTRVRICRAADELGLPRPREAV